MVVSSVTSNVVLLKCDSVCCGKKKKDPNCHPLTHVTFGTTQQRDELVSLAANGYHGNLAYMCTQQICDNIIICNSTNRAFVTSMKETNERRDIVLQWKLVIFCPSSLSIFLNDLFLRIGVYHLYMYSFKESGRYRRNIHLPYTN